MSIVIDRSMRLPARWRLRKRRLNGIGCRFLSLGAVHGRTQRPPSCLGLSLEAIVGFRVGFRAGSRASSGDRFLALAASSMPLAASPKATQVSLVDATVEPPDASANVSPA